MSIHGVLGEATSYPKTYDPSVLFAIARSIGRDEIFDKSAVAAAHLADGVDVWQAFELSWLDDFGVSQVAIARIIVPASSPNIVESKSLKLYLNSLNFSRFADVSDVKAVLEQDLSACIGAKVMVQIYPLTTDEFTVMLPMGECIDGVLAGSEVELLSDIDANLLGEPKIASQHSYRFYSNLLRSNCPVTNQPDWGTLSVSMTTQRAVDYQAILRYVLSFRQHNGFHEQCVEQIFAHFLQRFEPSSLLVQANYTRRGGIDINPVRVYRHDLPKVARQVRQ